MSVIQINNLSFAYEGSYDYIFEDVSFQLDTDWKTGLIGRNGRGKTTLMHLMRGKYKYSGSILSNVLFEYFPCKIEDASVDTLAVVEQVCPEYELWQLLRELNRLEVDEGVLYRAFHTLSNGEQTKVLLATLFIKENHFLLIDEPTNHLDIEARRVLRKYLNSKTGFILASHDRLFLDACVDHILAINRMDIQVQKGTFTSWYDNKQRQNEYERTQNKKLKREIEHLSDAAARTAQWSDKIEKSKYGSGPVDRGYVGHQAAKMMKRSKAIQSRRQEMAEEKSKLLKNIELTDSLKLSPLKYHKDKLISFEDVSVYYGERCVCEHLQFDICRNDRIALNGKNGSGKSSILKLICEEDLSYKGAFHKGSQLKISYVAQHPSDLSGNLTDYARSYGIEESLFKAILRKLDFPRIQFEKDMCAFSDGQKKKVLLARSLCEQAHLYVWDEPLNYIDVFSRMQIEQLLLAFEPTILFVEHEEAFVLNIATKKIEL